MRPDNPRRRQATRRAYAAFLCGATLYAAGFFVVGLCIGEKVTLKRMEQSTAEAVEVVDASEAVKVEAVTAARTVEAAPKAEVQTVTCVAEPEHSAEPAGYSDLDLETLALVIYQEAGGDACSDDTRLKVGTVVMNRVADDRFPDTLYEVVTQEGQYGRLYWTGLEWPERSSQPGEAHAVERAYEMAERILEGERRLPEDVIFQSEYILGEIVAEQDGFYFCR